MRAIDSWITRRFDQFGNVWSGSTPSTTTQAYWDGSIVWVTPNDLSKLNTPYLQDSTKRITEQGLRACSATLLRPGSIVISSRAPIGYVAIPTVEFCTNQGCKSIELRPGFDSEYAYYNITFNIEKLKQLGEGTTFAEVSKAVLSKVELRFPVDIAEQAKIAEVLSTVDRAIEQTEALIAKQQRIKTGLMQDLLTRGIDEHGNLRSEQTHEFKDSPLGRMPVEWELFTVDSLGDVVTGSTPSTSEEDYYNGDIMFVSPKDVSNASESIIQTEKTLTPAGLAVSRVIPANSICTVCIGSTIGKIGLTASHCATNQQINTLVPAISKDAEMLLFAMRLFLRPQLRREAGLQAVPIVNKALFSKMTLPFPVDRDEKARIRVALIAVSSRIDAQTTCSEKLRALKTALMQDLLTGKVRVTPLLEKEREAVTT